MKNPIRNELQTALRFESESYAAMRDLVPDLGLPASQRAPLDRRQLAAVSTYADAQRRLAKARSDANDSRRLLGPQSRRGD